MTSALKISNKKLDLQVFKRWSRKSYAAFASMNKEIKISCINASYNLLIPSNECGFSGFCYLPENGRDKNETDELEALNSEFIEMLVIQNASKSTIGRIGSSKKANKVLSTHFYSRNFKN